MKTKIYEKDDHIRVCEWLRHNKILFLHVPNEGKRSVQQAMMLQRMGLSKGAPDFLIFDKPPAHQEFVGVAIELKVNNNKPSKEQLQWVKDLRDRGWKAEVIWYYQAVIDYLEGLGFEDRERVEIMDL